MKLEHCISCEEFIPPFTKKPDTFGKSRDRIAGTKIKFIIDISDLEPLNLAYKSSNTEEDVIIHVF